MIHYDISSSPIIIDTDPGVDDLVSLLWILANRSIDVKALTITNGNVGIDKCVVNALRALELCGRIDIPVFKGSYRPMVKDVINAEWYHGKDGLGDLGLPQPSLIPAEGYAPVEMIRIVKSSPEPVTILALGPLTNIALAILLDNSFKDRVGSILFMGGAVRVQGNESARASYNVKVDSESAKLVYNSGIPIVQLGLDVCDLVTQRFEDLDAIVATESPIAIFLSKILYNRRDRVTQLPRDEMGNILPIPFPVRSTGMGLNDMTAAAYIINPEWFKTIPVYMDIETAGKCDGETIIDYKGMSGKKPNCLFAYDVDGPALVRRWVHDMKNFKI
jgi:inosine-uridine nucleoside N-ribohydrolase